MRARVALLTVAFSAVLMAGLNAAPAQATVQVTDCWTRNDTGHTAQLCVAVNYRRDADGKGVWIDLVRIYMTGDTSLFESKTEDCDNIRLWNDNQTVLWRKDNTQCDLYKSQGSITWYPGNHLTGSDGHIGWSFYPKLDGAVDPGYEHDHVDATN